MRSLQSLITDLGIVIRQPKNRKTRRAAQSLSRRIMKRLAKREKQQREQHG
jgi:hypothetical protein